MSRPCLRPGCASLQPCPLHKRKPFARTSKHAGGRAWQRTRARIFARDGYRCRYCGRPVMLAKDVVDHVVNRAAGGSDDDSNLVACCRACNEQKRRTEALRGRGIAKSTSLAMRERAAATLARGQIRVEGGQA